MNEDERRERADRLELGQLERLALEEAYRVEDAALQLLAKLATGAGGPARDAEVADAIDYAERLIAAIDLRYPRRPETSRSAF